MASNTQNSGYNQKEMLTMQQDAIRRVREMQRRANLNITGSNYQNRHNNMQRNQNFNKSINAQKNLFESDTSPIAENNSPNNTDDDFLTSSSEAVGTFDFLKSLNLDKEKIIIILLIIVLLNEGASQKTILALAYLLL